MGLILDTSILIAVERRRFRLPPLLAAYPDEQPYIASITASEFLHGMERANSPERRNARSAFMEAFLSHMEVLDFDLGVARRHAELWASLEEQGLIIGPYDLLIAATALNYDYSIATLNEREFKRVPNLRLVDIAPFTS